MGAVEQDMTLSEFAVPPIRCYDLLCAYKMNIHLIKNQ